MKLAINNGDLITEAVLETLLTQVSEAGEIADGIITTAKIGSLPHARVYHSIVQTATDSTSLILAFNSERHDIDPTGVGHHDPATNNTRLTCRTAGLYRIGFNIAFSDNGTAAGNSVRRQAAVMLNGLTVIGSVNIPPVIGSVTVVVLDVPYRLAVNDYVEVVVKTVSNPVASCDIGSFGNYSPEFFFEWVSP